VESETGGDTEHGKIERLAPAELAVGGAKARGGRQTDAGENLVVAFGQIVNTVAPVQRLGLEGALSLLRRRVEAGAVGAPDGGGVARRNRQTDFALGSDPADRTVALHAEVDGAAPLVVLIVIVAAGVQADVPPDRPHVAQDWGRDRADRLKQA